MPVLHVPASLRALCAGCDRIEVDGATLRAVFTAVARDYPELTARILDERGLRPDIAVAIDGSILDQSGLTDPVAPDAEIYLVPPIGGGAAGGSSDRRGLGGQVTSSSPARLAPCYHPHRLTTGASSRGPHDA